MDQEVFFGNAGLRLMDCFSMIMLLAPEELHLRIQSCYPKGGCFKFIIATSPLVRKLACRVGYQLMAFKVQEEAWQKVIRRDYRDTDRAALEAKQWQG